MGTTIAPVFDREAAHHRLDGYVRWLAELRLGAVSEAACDADGVLVARKVSDTPPLLPGPTISA